MKAQKTATILSREIVKAVGIVLYTLLSSNGVDRYLITVKDGVIDRETHLDCIGYANCHHCYHVATIEQIERDLVAAEAGLRNDEKLATFKAGMDAQYASDPRIEAEETARAYRDIAWDNRF